MPWNLETRDTCHRAQRKRTRQTKPKVLFQPVKSMAGTSVSFISECSPGQVIRLVSPSATDDLSKRCPMHNLSLHASVFSIHGNSYDKTSEKHKILNCWCVLWSLKIPLTTIWLFCDATDLCSQFTPWNTNNCLRQGQHHQRNGSRNTYRHKMSITRGITPECISQ